MPHLEVPEELLAHRGLMLASAMVDVAPLIAAAADFSSAGEREIEGRGDCPLGGRGGGGGHLSFSPSASHCGPAAFAPSLAPFSAPRPSPHSIEGVAPPTAEGPSQPQHRLLAPSAAEVLPSAISPMVCVVRAVVTSAAFAPGSFYDDAAAAAANNAHGSNGGGAHGYSSYYGSDSTNSDGSASDGSSDGSGSDSDGGPRPPSSAAAFAKLSRRPATPPRRPNPSAAASPTAAAAGSSSSASATTPSAKNGGGGKTFHFAHGGDVVAPTTNKNRTPVGGTSGGGVGGTVIRPVTLLNDVAGAPPVRPLLTDPSDAWGGLGGLFRQRYRFRPPYVHLAALRGYEAAQHRAAREREVAAERQRLKGLKSSSSTATKKKKGGEGAQAVGGSGGVTTKAKRNNASSPAAWDSSAVAGKTAMKRSTSGRAAKEKEKASSVLVPIAAAHSTGTSSAFTISTSSAEDGGLSAEHNPISADVPRIPPSALYLLDGVSVYEACKREKDSAGGGEVAAASHDTDAHSSIPSEAVYVLDCPPAFLQSSAGRRTPARPHPAAAVRREGRPHVPHSVLRAAARKAHSDTSRDPFPSSSLGSGGGGGGGAAEGAMGISSPLSPGSFPPMLSTAVDNTMAAALPVTSILKGSSAANVAVSAANNNPSPLSTLFVSSPLGPMGAGGSGAVEPFGSPHQTSLAAAAGLSLIDGTHSHIQHLQHYSFSLSSSRSSDFGEQDADERDDDPPDEGCLYDDDDEDGWTSSSAEDYDADLCHSAACRAWLRRATAANGAGTASANTMMHGASLSASPTFAAGGSAAVSSADYLHRSSGSGLVSPSSPANNAGGKSNANPHAAAAVGPPPLSNAAKQRMERQRRAEAEARARREWARRQQQRRRRQQLLRDDDDDDDAFYANNASEDDDGAGGASNVGAASGRSGRGGGAVGRHPHHRPPHGGSPHWNSPHGNNNGRRASSSAVDSNGGGGAAADASLPHQGGSGVGRFRLTNQSGAPWAALWEQQTATPQELLALQQQQTLIGQNGPIGVGKSAVLLPAPPSPATVTSATNTTSSSAQRGSSSKRGGGRRDQSPAKAREGNHRSAGGRDEGEEAGSGQPPDAGNAAGPLAAVSTAPRVPTALVPVAALQAGAQRAVDKVVGRKLQQHFARRLTEGMLASTLRYLGTSSARRLLAFDAPTAQQLNPMTMTTMVGGFPPSGTILQTQQNTVAATWTNATTRSRAATGSGKARPEEELLRRAVVATASAGGGAAVAATNPLVAASRPTALWEEGSSCDTTGIVGPSAALRPPAQGEVHSTLRSPSPPPPLPAIPPAAPLDTVPAAFLLSHSTAVEGAITEVAATSWTTQRREAVGRRQSPSYRLQFFDGSFHHCVPLACALALEGSWWGSCHRHRRRLAAEAAAARRGKRGASNTSGEQHDPFATPSSASAVGGGPSRSGADGFFRESGEAEGEERYQLGDAVLVLTAAGQYRGRVTFVWETAGCVVPSAHGVPTGGGGGGPQPFAASNPLSATPHAASAAAPFGSAAAPQDASAHFGASVLSGGFGTSAASGSLASSSVGGAPPPPLCRAFYNVQSELGDFFPFVPHSDIVWLGGVDELL